MSGYSRSKINRIITYWLSKEPPEQTVRHPWAIKYLLFDGTYFHKNGCSMVVMNSRNRYILGTAYVDNENYANAKSLFDKIRFYGIVPKAVMIDGHHAVIRALKDTWPQVLIQRCLFHIQRQGLQWLRTKPKTEAGRTLRVLIHSVGTLHTKDDMSRFIANYNAWSSLYRSFVKQLPWDSVAYKDLKKATALIQHAIPDMFHSIQDANIRNTTNVLESFLQNLKENIAGIKALLYNTEFRILCGSVTIIILKSSNTF